MKDIVDKNNSKASDINAQRVYIMKFYDGQNAQYTELLFANEESNRKFKEMTEALLDELDSFEELMSIEINQIANDFMNAQVKYTREVLIKRN